MNEARLLAIAVFLSCVGCGGGGPASGGVTVVREGVTTTIHPTVCSATSGSLGASENGGNGITMSVGDGSVGFRPGQPIAPGVVTLEIGGARVAVTQANCPNLAGTLTLTPTGERTATVSGTVHLDCPSADGAMIVGDLTFDGCEVGP